MKGLSIEQKAALYDEVMERAKNYLNDCPDRVDAKGCIEYLLPSLKESEDVERIRNFITNELACLRATDVKGSERYEELTKAIDWVEKQREQTSSQTNERAWLYLVSDVLTWKDGIGQYLDDPRVQELAKELRSEYAQKLYKPSVLSNSSNTGNNNQEPADKVEPKFNVGDWIFHKGSGNSFHINKIENRTYISDEGATISLGRQEDWVKVHIKERIKRGM